jgi:hypothetical protein
MSAGQIRTILFDADEVLQYPEPNRAERLVHILGFVPEPVAEFISQVHAAVWAKAASRTASCTLSWSICSALERCSCGETPGTSSHNRCRSSNGSIHGGVRACKYFAFEAALAAAVAAWHGGPGRLAALVLAGATITFGASIVFVHGGYGRWMQPLLGAHGNVGLATRDNASRQ